MDEDEARPVPPAELVQISDALTRLDVELDHRLGPVVADAFNALTPEQQHEAAAAELAAAFPGVVLCGAAKLATNILSLGEMCQATGVPPMMFVQLVNKLCVDVVAMHEAHGH